MPICQPRQQVNCSIPVVCVWVLDVPLSVADFEVLSLKRKNQTSLPDILHYTPTVYKVMSYMLFCYKSAFKLAVVTTNLIGHETITEEKRTSQNARQSNFNKGDENPCKVSIMKHSADGCQIGKNKTLLDVFYRLNEDGSKSYPFVLRSQ